MTRAAALTLALLSPLALDGCSRASKAGPAGVASAGAPVPSAAPAASGSAASTGAGGSAPMFSAPIAGAGIGKGVVIAAGLVVSRGAIAATRIDADGRTAWTKDVITGVKWSPDVELRAYALTAGVAIVWRGALDGRMRRQAVVVSSSGALVAPAAEVGAVACATDDGLAWSEASPAGGSYARLRVWSPSGRRDSRGPKVAGDFVLACTGSRAYAVDESDEDDRTRVFPLGAGAETSATHGDGGDVDGGARTAVVNIATKDLGSGEERDLLSFADGETLGLVRISDGGAVRVSELKAGKLVTTPRDVGSVRPEDDVVAVDADADAAYVVSTHDESDGACKDARSGDRVTALRVSRHENAGSTIDLAPPSCGVSAGPFWTNAFAGGIVVGWPERASRRESGAVVGLAYRVLDGARASSAPARIAVDADAIADAGCDEIACHAVVLARDGHADGMQPEAVRVVTFP